MSNDELVREVSNTVRTLGYVKALQEILHLIENEGYSLGEIKLFCDERLCEQFNCQTQRIGKGKIKWKK